MVHYNIPLHLQMLDDIKDTSPSGLDINAILPYLIFSHTPSAYKPTHWIYDRTKHRHNFVKLLNQWM